MSPRRPRPALLIAAAVLWASPAAAQHLAGIARGPDGEPLPDVTVAIHKVGAGGGEAVATGSTAADGTFRFDIPMADSALYFGAIRYNGSMYLGPGVRGGQGPVDDYIIQVGPDAEAGAVASALSGGGIAGDAGSGAGMPAAGGRAPISANGAAGAALLVAFLAMATAGIFVAAAPGYRRRRTRDELIEIARLQTGLESAEAGPEKEAMERKIRALKERLLPGG